MTKFALASLVVTLFACGKDHGTTTDANNGGDGGNGDGAAIDDSAGPAQDASFTPGCTAPIPSNPQCSNCIDDDNDGVMDGFDPECTGANDNDEGSFATGIPGDNKDAVNQDCFFDGDSGAGNDHCNVHVCCLLGATTVQACPIGANQYDPTQCPPPIGNTPLDQRCDAFCGPLAPAGCDCFGCCTVCNATGCYDVITNPITSPNCDETTLQDPTKCHTCSKVTSCGSDPCGGTTCTLCPGQDPSTLPTSCGGSTTCPGGEQACVNAACPTGTYCASGCCIGIIQ
ncbi:MAG: hypothetical protein NT062_07195 [Proteobacteria bacterium]|nr:hypothetical protein [Pseudomonadota bacterium]